MPQFGDCPNCGKRSLIILCKVIVLTITLPYFLAMDTTNTHPYINGSYVCQDFSRDLILNASEYHIYLDYVYIPKDNHMMVGIYNPLTKTITIIEPQNDQIIGTVEESNKDYIRIKVWFEYQYWYNVGRVN